jgi:hypothetical protein
MIVSSNSVDLQLPIFRENSTNTTTADFPSIVRKKHDSINEFYIGRIYVYLRYLSVIGKSWRNVKEHQPIIQLLGTFFSYTSFFDRHRKRAKRLIIIDTLLQLFYNLRLYRVKLQFPQNVRWAIYSTMPTQPPLPPLLAPYVSSLPQSSLTVLSSVLGATGNWLVLRFLYAALSAPSNTNQEFGLNGSDGVKKRKVVLVSFLRGWEFWRSEAKRLVSICPSMYSA